MASIQVWGPIVWTFFHVLAQKVKDENFSIIKVPLFEWIKSICKTLPCPDCSQHATFILNNVLIEKITTKQDFCGFLWTFHNIVNKRKQKPLFNISELIQYEKRNLIQCYNNFAAVYQAKGNGKLQTDSFQRRLVASQFKVWILANIRYFSL